MKQLILLLLLLSSIVSNAQNNITVVGEIRFGDLTTFRFREPTKVSLARRVLNGDAVPLSAVNLSMKEPFDRKPGTELRFLLPKDVYDQLRRNKEQISLNCKFEYESIKPGRFTSSTVILYVDLTKTEDVNEQTIKLKQPILLSAPEPLTLTMCVKDIQSDLLTKTKDVRDSSLFCAVRDLNRFTRRGGKEKIEFNTLMTYYQLLNYSNKYVNDKSFFVEEAKKLKIRIDELNITLTQYGAKIENREELTRELIDLNEIYEEYQKTYWLLKQYYEQTKLILLMSSN